MEATRCRAASIAGGRGGRAPAGSAARLGASARYTDALPVSIDDRVILPRLRNDPCGLLLLSRAVWYGNDLPSDGITGFCGTDNSGGIRSRDRAFIARTSRYSRRYYRSRFIVTDMGGTTATSGAITRSVIF